MENFQQFMAIRSHAMIDGLSETHDTSIWLQGQLSPTISNGVIIGGIQPKSHL
jgi:hypothetical protein